MKGSSWRKLWNGAGTGCGIHAVNRDYPEEDIAHTGFSRKVKADLFIDDRNLGGLPDWGSIYRMIHDRLTYEELFRENSEPVRQKKKGFWARLKNNIQRRFLTYVNS